MIVVGCKLRGVSSTQYVINKTKVIIICKMKSH